MQVVDEEDSDEVVGFGGTVLDSDEVVGFGGTLEEELELEWP